MDAVMFDASPPTILVVEDDPMLGRLLREALEAEGFVAVLAPSGEEGLSFALREVPQLLLLDIMLPGIDGFEVVNRLRAHAKTAHIPVVMLSARHDTAVRVNAFEHLVDDFLTKPYNHDELMARIGMRLRQVRENLLSPLTGLPSGLAVERAIEHQLAAPGAWSILYIDLDNFKAYNDAYGFLRGNELIRLLAQLAADAVRTHGNLGDFVCHVGGDDFVVITTPERVAPVCEQLIATWDRESRAYYSAEDLARGSLRGTDRQGQPQTYPLLGVSIGVVTNAQRPITSIEAVSQIAAEVKHKAKSIPGSAYYVDQRTHCDGHG
ncbi:MAG: response regulator [Ktedonobacterales bacterium]